MWHALWPDRAARRGADRPRHQRRPHPDLDRRRRCASCSTATWAPDWLERAADPRRGPAVDQIPDAELWEVRERQRAELVSFIRERSIDDRLARSDLREYVEAAARAFDPDVLTIGFARRVATYKRLELLIRDPEWTMALLGGDRPVQVVLAGKAHPRDDEAKRSLQRAVRAQARAGSSASASCSSTTTTSRRRPARARLRRVAEPAAAAARGQRHERDEVGDQRRRCSSACSTAGGPRPTTATTAGRCPGDVDHDHDAQDDARRRHASPRCSTMRSLPAFYDRDAGGCRRAGWRVMRASLRTLGPRFCADADARGVRFGPLPKRLLRRLGARR